MGDCSGAFLFGLAAGALFLGGLGFIVGLVVEDALDVLGLRDRHREDR